MGLCNGDVWYSQQAFRALNQGIGRCIRHKDDFGAILLLDSRYLLPNRLKSVSKWMQPSLERHEDFDRMKASAKRFFERNQTEIIRTTTQKAEQKEAEQKQTKAIEEVKVNCTKETKEQRKPRLVQQTLQVLKVNAIKDNSENEGPKGPCNLNQPSRQHVLPFRCCDGGG